MYSRVHFADHNYASKELITRDEGEREIKRLPAEIGRVNNGVYISYVSHPQIRNLT